MKYLKYFENLDAYNFSNRELITLKDLSIPKHIDGNFNCEDNKLSSLEYGPEYVGGDFNAEFNQLMSLEFCPIYVGGSFDVSSSWITSLEYIPEHIGGSLIIDYNKITSLEYCPEIINGGFICNHNKLTSLEFGPKKVMGNFNCSDNNLTSLDFCPDYVEGDFNCSNNKWSAPIPYELIKKYDIQTRYLYNFEQIAKFSSYKYQKEFLTENPEKYKDLEPIGYDDQIIEEFDWLFNAANMGLM